MKRGTHMTSKYIAPLQVKTTPTNFSAYQVAIFNWVKNAQRGECAFAEAVAGSGKTTTLTEAVKYIPKGMSILFLAFGKDIVTELKARLGESFPASTLNSLGHRIIMANVKGRLNLFGGKYSVMVKKALSEGFAFEGNDLHTAHKFMTELISLSMSSCADGSDESLEAVMEHYAIDVPKAISQTDAFNLVRSCLDQGLAMAKQGQISYDDQIWVPVKMGWKPQQSDWLLIDEAQDLSKAKLELAMSAVKPGGNILFAGDRNQSIFGFAGADAFAVENIISRTNAVRLPLSINYRCALKIVEHAQQLVPELEACDTAPEGELSFDVPESRLLAEATSKDMILCRVTNPLIGMAIKFIRNGKPAKVLGRNVGNSLIDTAKNALQGRPWDELDEALTEFEQVEGLALMKRRNPEAALQLLGDKVAGVRACNDGWRNANGSRITSLEEFIKVAKELDAEGATGNFITLSSIHRMKGKEAGIVWNIAPEKNFLTWNNQRDWEILQERNLAYVLRTRAKLALRYVRTEK